MVKYFVQLPAGEMELVGVNSFQEAQELVRTEFRGTGSHLVMERRYTMSSEIATTVDTGEV